MKLKPLRLGTRGSRLARWQAGAVAEELRKLDVDVEIVLMTTPGDIDRSGPIGTLGSQGVFTKTIQQALLDGSVDLAVHSLKDLPTEPIDGLTLAAVPPRAAVADALVGRAAARLADLPPGALIGTGSLRRRAQLLSIRDDLQVADLRGNLETRLQKVDRGDYDAIVLAVAGLTRLNLDSRITEVFDPNRILPAVGQGALGIETRADDPVVRDAVSPLDHAPSHQAVVAERAMLAQLQGGCLAPVGAWARLVDGQLALTATVLSPDGTERLDHHATAPPTAAVDLGETVAAVLLTRGADRLIAMGR
jgi:hydroxymethylbilane synthase